MQFFPLSKRKKSSIAGQSFQGAETRRAALSPTL
jgi:hypothetical protein